MPDPEMNDLQIWDFRHKLDHLSESDDLTKVPPGLAGQTGTDETETNENGASSPSP